MGTDKRERKKANRAAKAEAERAAEARRRRIKMIRNAVILAVVIVIALVLLNGCSSDPAPEKVAAGAGTTEVEKPDDGYGTTPCPKSESVGPGAPEPVLEFDDSFQRCIDPTRSYQATIETTEGTVVVDLDTTRTPITTNNFVALARSGYYDGTRFFRTEAKTGIIQGGAPHTQSNIDPGPGYTITDEGIPFSKDDYGPGTLAMARTSEPNSASAQFFFLANDGARYLGDPKQAGAGTYQVFGKVTQGLDVLKAIAALDDGAQVPSQPTSIISVKITES